MAILKVYKYPHPILREPCLPVTVWDDTLQQLILDMTETMYTFPGAVGLSAPQVGSSLRIFTMDVTAKTTRDQLRVMINPIITQRSRNKMVREGCLSFPDYLANVKRSLKLTVEAYDVSGMLHTYELEHLEAVAVQHELDHLDGILMIDRIASLKTDWIRRHGGTPEDLS